MPSPPADVQRDYVEMTFTVKNKGVIDNGRVSFRPEKVIIEHHIGLPVTVFVKGPVVRKDKTLSSQRAQIIYGRFGNPLTDAPDWVQLLIIKFERMVRAYA